MRRRDKLQRMREAHEDARTRFHLVQADQVDGFRVRITEGYRAGVGIEPEIYVSSAADGVCSM